MILDAQDLEDYLRYLIDDPIVGESKEFDNAFSCIGDVFSNFAVPVGEREFIKICHAVYDTPPYQGDAAVFYYDIRDEKFYENHGSHCSCHGLEDCWDPEEINFSALFLRCEKGGFTGKAEFDKRHEDYVIKCFGRVK